MLKTVEIRETYDEPGCFAEIRERYSADDVRVQISGEEVTVFIKGKVRKEHVPSM